MRPNVLLRITVLVLVLVLLVLTGCVPGDGKHDLNKPAGFFWGIWHGWIAPVSLVIGLVKKNVRLYEVFNTGWCYDFGFYMAILGGFGGFSLFRKKKRRS